MKIYVEKVLDEVVYFSTDYGNAKGIWKGNNRPIDKVYYVEMDIDMLCDYESFVLCDTKEYHIEMVNGNIQISFRLKIPLSIFFMNNGIFLFYYSVLL